MGSREVPAWYTSSSWHPGTPCDLAWEKLWGGSRTILRIHTGPSLSGLCSYRAQRAWWLASWDGPLGNRIFPRGASSGVVLVMPLGCPYCLKSQRRVMDQVRMEPVSQPGSYCQLGWKTSQGWALRFVSQGETLPPSFPSSKNVERGCAPLCSRYWQLLSGQWCGALPSGSGWPT